MPTKEQKADYYLLSVWAGPMVHSVAEGYDAVQQRWRLDTGTPLSRGKAKAMIHLALERLEINPHHSPSLIRAWVELNRRLKTTGDIA